MLSVIEIDREHDVAYILVQPELRDRRGGVARSVRVADDIVLDLDVNGQLVGIELLQASARLDLSTLSDGLGDLILGVKEAAELLGVERSNFIRDHANKPHFPAPIAELASGRLWLRGDIERYVRDKAAAATSTPMFSVGDLVTLRSDPSVVLPIIEIISGGAETRYRVFENNAKAIYYERQLQRQGVSEDDDARTLSATQLRARLTGLQILSPSTTNLFSLRMGRVEFVPYQYRPVMRIVRADKPRLLIADEVGVGKTIEAGLIIKELRARMELSSVLVICPKALVAEQKWTTEMRRFDEQFAPLDGPLLRHCLRETDLEGEWPEQYAKAILPFSLFDSELVLGSNGKRRNRGLLDLNPAPRFDLVIVDEAHHIRNPETFLHQGVRYFCDNANAVLLLTATPVQLGSNDLFTLLNVLRPDLIIDRSSFEQMAAPNPHINAAIQQCRIAQPNWTLEAAAHLRNASNTEWGHLFLRDNPAFTAVVERLESNSANDSDRVALTRAIEELYTFSPLINRTRRRDIGEFTTRKPETVSVEFTEQHKRLHDGLLDVVARILVRCHGQQNVKFMMTTIRRQAASCLYGLAPLLSDILNGKLDRLEHMEAIDRDEEPDLGAIDAIRSDVRLLLEQARDLDPYDPKVTAFTKLLLDKNNRSNNKALVFSTFRHSLAYLDSHVQRTGLRVAVVHGDIPDDERSDIRRRFALPKEHEDALDVMLSSEVGCEGLDFQFCDFLVNYDLPWNPMRIEQRIGRIDRYGQTSPTVAIVNFITPGTVDAEIYDRCLWRIGVFQHAVGGNEEILGEITRELHDIAESFSLSPAERTQRLKQLADNAIRHIREEEELESKQSELFGLNVPQKAWRRELETFETFWLSPAALEGAVTTYLDARLGGQLEHFLGDKPLKTLRLSQEARAALLDDFKRLPRSIEPIARDWEKWLRGNQPTLTVTFYQRTAKEHPKAAHLSVLHPLVRQAAHFLEITEPRFCALRAISEDLKPVTFHFALYRWTKHGIRPDELLVPVTSDPTFDDSLLRLLEVAVDDEAVRLPSPAECDALDARHHSRWLEAQTRHIAANRELVEHQIHSLTVSHATRRQGIEDQVSRATNEKIRLMKSSELARAESDFTLRLAQLRRAASSGDIRATPVLFGTMSVVQEERR